MAVTTVGAFTFDSETNTVSGPAEYMKSAEYAARIKAIESGTDSVFRAGIEYSPTPIVALLVSIQTDYAGWKGMQQFNRARGLG